MLIFIATVSFLCILLYKFCFGDGDFTLVLKGHPKRDAIEDKVVWITGASRGIGEVLAGQLAGLGAKLILSARNENELERVRSQLRGKHAPNDVMILPLDLASGEELLRKAVERAESFFSGAGVHYMLHNAAFERPKTSAQDVPEEIMKAAFDVNVFGAISLTKLLVPSMIGRGKGHFVVISSAAAKVPAPGQALYSATKSALHGYFHTMRSELCQKGIKVTVVCPGPINTGSAASSERLSCERCAELIIVAFSHCLKEAWISCQPVLGLMFLAQYIPSLVYWLMDKIGAKRLEAASQKENTYSLALLFGKKKTI